MVKIFFKVTFFLATIFFSQVTIFLLFCPHLKQETIEFFYKGFIPAIVAASTAASTTVGYTCYQEGKSWSDHNSLVTTAGKSHVTARAF